MNNTGNERFCQSCGMPLTEEKLYGTNADGTKTDEFCLYCFKDGDYIDKDMTMDQMLDICVREMKKQGMPDNKARDMMEEVLPKLKRWQ